MLAAIESRTRPEFDPRTNAYHVEHDHRCDWPVSTTVVLSLSSLTGTDPLAMRPLNGVVDPEALDFHVRSRARECEMAFDFCGHHVTVRADGHVEFIPLDDREP